MSLNCFLGILLKSTPLMPTSMLLSTLPTVMIKEVTIKKNIFSSPLNVGQNVTLSDMHYICKEGWVCLNSRELIGPCDCGLYSQVFIFLLISEWTKLGKVSVTAGPL